MIRHPRSPRAKTQEPRATALAETFRGRLAHGADAALYDDLVLYLLYQGAEPAMVRVIAGDEPPTRRFPDFATLAAEVRHYLAFPALGRPHEPAHVLALFFQIRRAFHFTIEHILGGSLPAARLRAAVWQAIFTRDKRRSGARSTSARTT